MVVPIEQPRPNQRPPTTKAISGGHTTKAEKQITVEKLRLYLEQKGSPLAPYSEQILASPYWSTIIGICTIEQYGCTRAPYNNYWGIGPGKKYATPEEGITTISEFLAKADKAGRNTLEKLNGWYVVPASSNWFNVVLTTKTKLENL